MEQVEQRKCDALSDALDRAAEALSAQADRLAALEAKFAAVLEVVEKHTAALTAQQGNLNNLALAVVDGAKTQAAVEDVLAEHKTAIEKIATVIKGASSGPPRRALN